MILAIRGSHRAVHTPTVLTTDQVDDKPAEN